VTWQIRYIAIGLVALAGCHKSTPPPAPLVDAGPSCASNDDCDAAEVCDTNTGKCGPCKSSGQCKSHQICQAPARNQPLQCQYAPGYGDDCKLNDDCPAGQLCRQGLCLDSSAVTTCPTGACPSGQRCNASNLVCEENSGCFSDADCDAAGICNTATHACDVRCTDANADLVCAAGQKCVAGRCAQCGADSDCPGGLTCDTAAGTCTNGNTCFSDRDCTVPLVCNPATSQCTQPPPPCVSDEQCKLGDVCNLASGRCAPAGCQPDRYEPGNHDQAHAAAIGPGPDIRVPDLTLCAGQQDFFSFDMLQGDIVQVVVEADPLAAQTFDTALLDPQGRVIASGDLAVNGQADSDGTYAVRIHSTDPEQDYSLRVTIDHTSSSCQNDAYEPNDTVPQATHVSPPGLTTLAICAGDHDWFSIDVPANLGVNLAESSDPTQGDIDLYAYASDGTTLLASSATSAATERVQLGPGRVGGQRIYALVQGGDPRSAAQYGLAVSYRTDEPDAGPPDAGPDAGDFDGGLSDAGADAGAPDAGMDGGA
jgi:hypothetical protein